MFKESIKILIARIPLTPGSRLARYVPIAPSAACGRAYLAKVGSDHRAPGSFNNKFQLKKENFQCHYQKSLWL